MSTVFLPISSLMSFYYFISTGAYTFSSSLRECSSFRNCFDVFGYWKIFCSWLCPVGFLSELIGDFGEKAFQRKIQLPKILDYPLRSLKYLMLGFLFYAVFFLMSSAAIKAFLDSPYNLVADLKMFTFFADISQCILNSHFILIHSFGSN
ncbi:MAG: 4Fe-4S binding protein [Ignavibacteriales bacterium]|nr:4Fe-4S binding protein [Ignavibacteriales bacterium]